MTLKQPNLTSAEIQKYLFFHQMHQFKKGTKKFNNYVFFKSRHKKNVYYVCVMMCGEHTEGTCDAFLAGRLVL